MKINEYLKQAADAIKEENSKTQVAIVPKYFKAGIAKDERLKPLDIKLLYTLHEYINTDTGHCYPSQKELADVLGSGQSSISKALTRLEEAGYIHKVPAKRINKNKKFEDTSQDIIITPFAKLKDSKYHEDLVKEIERIKYIIVDYIKIKDSEDGIKRVIISTGEHTNSKKQEEVNEIKENGRQESIKAKQTIAITEEVKAEIKEEQEEVKYNPDAPSNQEMDAYYKQKEQSNRQEIMSNKQGGVNLLKQNTVYYHPTLTGISAPTITQNEVTGEFINNYNESSSKPESFAIEDFINLFYREFNIPSAKMNIKRDKGLLRRQWSETYVPAAQTVRVEPIDLMLFTLDAARYLSYDTDKKIEDIKFLTDYIDEAMGSVGDKKTVLANNEVTQKSNNEMDVQKAIELENMLYEYESRLSYAPHIIAGAFCSKFPEVDLTHLKKYLEVIEEEFVFETYMQSL